MQKKILIVEDDTLLSDALQQVFTKHDCAVRTVHNGRDGLGAITADRPDFILLDLMMPEMTGIEMLTELQKDPANADIPVTVLTNANDLESVTQVMSRGGYHYFIKADTPLAVITNHVLKELDMLKAEAIAPVVA